MGPIPTGNILVIYGHGLLATDVTFTCARQPAQRITLHVFSAPGRILLDSQMQLVTDNAMQHGTIPPITRTIESRIKGALFTEHVVGAPAGLATPNFALMPNNTFIPALNSTVFHNQPTLGGSNRMILMVTSPTRGVRLSEIINDTNFSNRSLDIMWCACRSD